MEAFPFTEADWAALSEAALPVLNATLANDAVPVRASRFVRLRDVLANLRAKYGEHPVLLETEADFTDDLEQAVNLYRQAIGMAVAHGLSTLSIRLALARLLLNAGLREAACVELLSCEGEARESDESDQVSWAELIAESRAS